MKRKRPIIISSSTMDDIDDKKFDIRLKEGFKLFIAGPSRSGKTFLLIHLYTTCLILLLIHPKLLFMSTKYGNLNMGR